LLLELWFESVWHYDEDRIVRNLLCDHISAYRMRCDTLSEVSLHSPLWRTDQYADEINYGKPVAESAIETNEFILCFKYAVLLLVSAIAFLTGGVHLLFTE